MQSFSAEIKSRGQLTIPKKVRDMMHLDEGQTVSIIPVGDSVVLSAKRLELDDARRQIRRIMRQSGCSVDELMSGLHDERENLYQDLYGKKND
jgi:AbrB family looped-hinge helix DNA binding protein